MSAASAWNFVKVDLIGSMHFYHTPSRSHAPRTGHTETQYLSTVYFTQCFFVRSSLLMLWVDFEPMCYELNSSSSLASHSESFTWGFIINDSVPRRLCGSQRYPAAARKQVLQMIPSESHRARSLSRSCSRVPAD